MMRSLKFILTLGTSLIMLVLMVLSGVYGQSATPDPIDITSTAFVVEATQQAQLQGFSAQSASVTGGTATPLAGVCNTLTFRALDDVSMMVETFFQRSDRESVITLRSVDASAIEETADCVQFGVRETVVDVVFDVTDLATLNDESILGGELAEVLKVISQTIVTSLAEVRLKVAFIYGNQTRLFDITTDVVFWSQLQEVQPAEFVDWLTERGIE